MHLKIIAVFYKRTNTDERLIVEKCLFTAQSTHVHF